MLVSADIALRSSEYRSLRPAQMSPMDDAMSPSEALLPRFVDGCRQRIQQAPWRQFFIGLAIFMPLFAAGISGIRAPQAGLKFSGIVLLLALLLWALVGSSGVAAQVGVGLGFRNPDWRRVLRGGSVLGLTFILPFLGWFLMLVTFIIGIGATVGGLRRKTPE